MTNWCDFGFDLVLATCAAWACFGCLTCQPEALSPAQPCPPASRIGSSKGSRHWKTTPGTALHHLWPPERSLQIPSGGRRATACDWNLGIHWPNSLTHPQESSKAWLQLPANRAWWMLGLCSMFLSLLIWRGNIYCTLSASSRAQSRSLGCRFSMQVNDGY